jgi:hypothetical protein
VGEDSEVRVVINKWKEGVCAVRGEGVGVVPKGKVISRGTCGVKGVMLEHLGKGD